LTSSSLLASAKKHACCTSRSQWPWWGPICVRKSDFLHRNNIVEWFGVGVGFLKKEGTRTDAFRPPLGSHRKKFTNLPLFPCPDISRIRLILGFWNFKFQKDA
jgi:hypothetical protein